MEEHVQFSNLQLNTSRAQRRVLIHHYTLMLNSVFKDRILHDLDVVSTRIFRVVNLWILMNNYVQNVDAVY